MTCKKCNIEMEPIDDDSQCTYHLGSPSCFKCTKEQAYECPKCGKIYKDGLWWTVIDWNSCYALKKLWDKL